MQILSASDFRVGFLAGVASVVLTWFVWLALRVVIKPWAMATAAGVNVGVLRLVGMKLRGSPPELIIMARVIDQKRGGQISLDVLEAAYLAYPDPRRTASDLLDVAVREFKSS